MRHPDPCYCEQATVYERLLERAIESLDCSGHASMIMLAREIERTIDKYEQAQEDYLGL
jgi:hypothetical protein